MKTALGLDERDPTCFLCTHSIVMVLRKVRARVLRHERKTILSFPPTSALPHLTKGLCLLLLPQAFF